MNALVVAAVVVVGHKGLDLGFQIAWEVVVLQQNAVLQRLVPMLDFACLYRKSDFAIMVMKSSEDGRRYDAAHVLDGAMDRSVFVERPVCPQLVVIGGILRQNLA
jgi:hypothetical protein